MDRSRYTKPDLREKLKKKIQASSKGGKKGQWSARKAQLLVQEYEKAGGGYKKAKSAEQKHLSKWSAEDWQTKDGDTKARMPDGSVKRYLPKRAWDRLNDDEKRATDRRKRRKSEQGVQFVPNTKAAKRAGRKARNADSLSDKSKDELLGLARDLAIPGRSSMSKDTLAAHIEKAERAQRAKPSRSGGKSGGSGGETKQALYEKAKREGISGRSKMTKPELRKALRSA